MEAWQTHQPKESINLGPGVVYSFQRCGFKDDHEHTKECVWIWHYCEERLGPTSVSPGSNFGWRPSGIGAHELVSLEPLTISPSVYWPECCNKHGFITDGIYTEV